MRTALASARGLLAGRLVPEEKRDLDAMYETNGGAAVWLDADSHPTSQAHAALALLATAGAEGLDTADYDHGELTSLASSPGVGASEADAARFDTLLTAGMLRYFRHVHLGRVDPRRLDLQLQVPDDGHDFPLLLRTAIDGRRLTATAGELAPQVFQYEALKVALGRYRMMAAGAHEAPIFTTVVHPGDAVPREPLAALRRLLLATGDLHPGASPASDGTYDATLETGVVSFQRRHGLATDGVIGKATQEAMRVPLAWRARQIELALERLRWLPDLSRGRLIAVNIPMFRLWAWDQIPSSQPSALNMAVIVGRALDTRTPVFAESMQHVVFRPYWNVPVSILRGELLPAIRRDPGYLARESLEIVDGPADGSPVLAPAAEHIEALGQNGVRLRQRPGPRNALGLIKFMFPNMNDVYMHGTPAPQLFARARRDFSHGCIRVEDPVGLAEWVLQDDPTWRRERIVDAMQGAPNRRVDLPRPVQVIIFYTTAVVQPEDGAVHFADDLYGHDIALDGAL